MRHLSEIFGDIPGIFWQYFQINANCLYVCQSVSQLTSLQILNKCRDISCSERDIFMKFVWDISGMFAHYFKIITNFLFVCQLVSWLTSLLKLGQNRDISCPGWDIFLKLFGDIPGMSLQVFQILPNFLYVCQSVSWLTSLLKLDKYQDISSSWWYIFLILLRRLFWNICILDPNNLELFVCLSVC